MISFWCLSSCSFVLFSLSCFSVCSLFPVFCRTSFRFFVLSFSWLRPLLSPGIPCLFPISLLSAASFGGFSSCHFSRLVRISLCVLLVCVVFSAFHSARVVDSVFMVLSLAPLCVFLCLRFSRISVSGFPSALLLWLLAPLFSLPFLYWASLRSLVVVPLMTSAVSCVSIRASFCV